MAKVENATEQLAFRCTPSERKTIERAADKKGQRISDYLRERVLGEERVTAT